MDVNCLIRVALFIVVCWSLSFAQSMRASYDPASRQASRKSKDDFIDYTLKRINPADTDYGKCLGEIRRLMLEETVESGYFWSNLTALGLLACLFLIIAWQHANQARSEWSTAEVLVQYEHALARANAQLSDVTSRNHKLMNALTNARELEMREPSTLTSEHTARPMEAACVPRPKLTPSKVAVAKTTGHRTAGPAVIAESGNQIALFTPDVDLMMTVNSLKQQLAHSEEKCASLQRRVATGRDLESEHKQDRAKVVQPEQKPPAMT